MNAHFRFPHSHFPLPNSDFRLPHSEFPIPASHCRPSIYRWIPLLGDPLQLSGSQIAVPRALAPLLGLMDGTRDEAGLEAALQVRAGIKLAPGLLTQLLADLDDAYLLDNERFQGWITRSLAATEYRYIGSAAAIEPRGCCIDLDLVKIVMAVPFEPV